LLSPDLLKEYHGFIEGMRRVAKSQEVGTANNKAQVSESLTGYQPGDLDQRIVEEAPLTWYERALSHCLDLLNFALHKLGMTEHTYVEFMQELLICCLAFIFYLVLWVL
jgi:hypothetical protein